MKTYKLTSEERYQLILACRSSGLTDHQWCLQNGIPPTSFYRWLKRFRDEGYPDINPTDKAQTASVCQEAVKINIVPKEPANHLVCNYEEKSNHSSYYKTDELTPAIEIARNNTIIRINNHANPQLLDVILRNLGGSL